MIVDTYSDTYLADYGDALWVFTPPTLDRVPPILPDTRGLQRALFRHYKPYTQGLNLYLMPDGTYLQDTQPPHLSNPDPGRPEWNTDAPVKVYYGGHQIVMDDREAAALDAAGYGAYITPYGSG